MLVVKWNADGWIRKLPFDFVQFCRNKKKQTTIHHLLFLHPLGSGGIGKGGKQFPKYEFQPSPTKKNLVGKSLFKRGNNDYINIL